MDRNTQTEVFIQTLAEMLDHERECQKARLRIQVRTHVDRFMKEFGTGPVGRRRMSASPVQSRPTGQKTGPQMQDE